MYLGTALRENGRSVIYYADRVLPFCLPTTQTESKQREYNKKYEKKKTMEQGRKNVERTLGFISIVIIGRWRWIFCNMSWVLCASNSHCSGCPQTERKGPIRTIYGLKSDSTMLYHRYVHIRARIGNGRSGSLACTRTVRDHPKNTQYIYIYSIYISYKTQIQNSFWVVSCRYM